MSSSNLKSKTHKKYGFSKIYLNENAQNMPNELKTTNYIQSFPKKTSSKIFNNIYDKIDRIIKSKSNQKSKLKLKKNNKNKPIKLTSNNNTNISYDYFEENKNNKFIQTNLYNLKRLFNNHIDNKILSNGFTNNINNYFFEDNYKYNNIKNKIKIFDIKSIIKKNKTKNDKNPFIHNKKTNNYYSCSNNYVVNYKRKNKNKYLNDYSEGSSLNEILTELLLNDDNYTKFNSLEK